MLGVMSRIVQVVRIGLLASFMLGWCLPVVGQKRGDEIVIGTWNLEWFYDHQTGDNFSKLSKEKSAPNETEWEWKLSSVAKIVAARKPYIMAFQELENRKVLFDLKNRLRSKYGLSYRIGFVEGFDTFTEQDVGLLFRDGLVEMSRKEQNSEQWKSRKFGNLSKHLFGRFEWTVGGRKQNLTLLNLHLRAMPEREADRVRQALLAREWINQELARGQDVIVLGDLNTEHAYGAETATSDVGTLRGLNDNDPANDLLDVHQLLAGPQRVTHFTGKQFDRILCSRSLMGGRSGQASLVLKSAFVDRKPVVVGQVDSGDQRWNNVYAIPRSERDISDHYPLFARFVFE